MTSKGVSSLVLLAFLISSFHGASSVFEVPGKYAVTDLDAGKTGLFGVAFADEGDSSDNQNSDNQKTSTEGEHSSQGSLQFQESNQTTNIQNPSESENNHQSEHQAENQVTHEDQNQTEHETENANKTEAEHQAEQRSAGEIENENNNLNATHSATEQDVSDIAEAKTNQTIAAQVDIGAGNVAEKSIDSNVVVKVQNTTNDAINMTVSASSQSGPKVILINLNSTTIDVGNIKYLHIMYDGQPIAPAASVAQVLHPASSDQPHFAILVTQSGAQILISIPHFSTHTITITSLSKVIPSVPEFGPVAGIVLILSIISVVMVSRKVKFPLS